MGTTLYSRCRTFGSTVEPQHQACKVSALLDQSLRLSFCKLVSGAVGNEAWSLTLFRSVSSKVAFSRADLRPTVTFTSWLTTTGSCCGYWPHLPRIFSFFTSHYLICNDDLWTQLTSIRQSSEVNLVDLDIVFLCSNWMGWRNDFTEMCGTFL